MDHASWQDIAWEESGQVGFLHFEFYNGAMSTTQCQRLREALAWAKTRPVRVIVLAGGADFWSNGIHLNVIEHAESPADESWANINAMNDLALELINSGRQITIAALAGNAGAGGCFLARAADLLWARDGVMLNPHYKNMGNLYGSEYWTYLLPRRVGEQGARDIMRNRQPLTAQGAVEIGFSDACLAGDPDAFRIDVARARWRSPRRPTWPAPGGQARTPRRRRSREAACRLSRRGTGADAAQFLRLRSELPRRAPPLRAQVAGLVDTAPPGAASRPRLDRSRMNAPAPLTVLVVDDEPRSLETLRRTLEEDFTVFTAQSAEKGETIMAREFVHIVLSDQRMPGTSGRRVPAPGAQPVAGHGAPDPFRLYRCRGHHRRHQPGRHLAIPAQALASRTTAADA
jgi:enoyl-CoA hydratase/carnithine racemase